jgi:hypothetical protein
MHRQGCLLPGNKGTLEALLFHIHEDEPRLVNIPFMISDFGTMLLHESPWFLRSPRLRMISRHVVKNIPESTDHNLVILYANDSLLADVPANRCVQRATRGRCTHPFRNNLLVFRADKWRGPLVIRGHCRSACMEDVPTVVEDLVEWGQHISRCARNSVMPGLLCSHEGLRQGRRS